MPDMIIPGEEPSSKRVRIQDQPQERQYEPSEPDQYEPSLAPDPPDDNISDQIEDPQPVPVETTDSPMHAPEQPAALESTATEEVPESDPPHIQSDDEGLLAESNPVKSAEVMEMKYQ